MPPNKVPLYAEIPADLRDEVRAYAAQVGITQTAAVTVLLRAGLAAERHRTKEES